MKSSKKKALELKLDTLRRLSLSELDQVQGGRALEYGGSGSCKPSNCGDTCDTVGGMSGNDYGMR